MNFTELLKAKNQELLAIYNKATTEGRALTDEEKTTETKLLAEKQELQDKIDIAVKNAKIVDENKLLNEPTKLFAEPRNADAKIWKNKGEFFEAVKNASTPNNTPDNRLFLNASGANVQVPSEGGFLVGEDMATELLKNTYETAQLASRCAKTPIGANSNKLVQNTIDETSRVDGSRYGGVQAFWSGEADTVTASKPKFGKLEIELDKLTAICYATEEMLADSTQLGSLLPEIFTEEMAYNLDNAILTGSGVGMPLGILNSGALITVAKETNQAAKTITYANVLNMWARLTPKSRANAVWYYNIDAEPQIYTMYQATGSTGVPVFTPAGVTADGVARLFGRPMIPIEQASTLGTVGDISVFDMSQYRLIEKGGIDAQQSIHVRFLYGENTFRFVYRANGKPMPKTAITPAKGSNTLSPFVTLATRG